jgi:sugar porter (SP) family MFS transporter
MGLQMSNTAQDRRKYYILFLLFFGGLGGLLYGYDLGVISGALLFMHRDLQLSTAETSLIVGSVLGGGAFATLVSGYIADKIGRKPTLFLANIIFLIGVLVLVLAHNFTTALTGRLLQGAGIGIQLIVLPLYLAETAPPTLRGKCVTIYQMFVTIGILLAYGINIAFAAYENWRGMFLCVFIPAVALFILTFFVTESPRWLFLRNKTSLALSALLRTTKEAEAQHAIEVMKELEHAGKQIEHKSSVWHKRYMVPFVIALAIACLNQLTGINSVIQFGTYILKQSGMSSTLLAMVGTVGLGLVNVLSTFIGITLVDRVGRKFLLKLGTGGTVCSLLFLGLVSLFGHASHVDGYLILIGLLVYIALFAIGPGIVVYLAISELIPTRIRSVGMATCLFVNSVVSAVLASLFLVLVKHINYSGTFLMCAGFTIIYFLIAAFVLPETKNKSLEEIEQYFSK